MRLRALHDAAKTVGLLDDEAAIAKAGVVSATAAFRVGAVVLIERATAHGRFYPCATTCENPVDEFVPIDPDRIHTACIVRRGEALGATDVTGGTESVHGAYAEFSLAPLQVRGRTVGLLGIKRPPETLDHIDLELLCGMASVIAVAIAQARSRDRAVDEARKRARLTQYFSPQIATHLVSGAAAHVSQGVRLDASILFADIRGFTAFSHGKQPSELMAFLNHYFSRMVHSVLAHGGMVDKLLGDGILAVFGAPLPLADHAIRAARCALEMRQQTTTIPFGPPGAAPVRVGIGIESGPIVVGDVGGGGFLDFTVLGETVNIASRIEALTKTFGVDVLVGPRTRAELGTNATFEAMPPHEVRGAAKPVPTYRLMAVGD